MILDELKQIQTDAQHLKKFGLLLFVILNVVAGISYMKDGNLFVFLVPLSIFVAVFSIISPNILKIIYWPWMAGAIVVGWVASHLILTILYFFVITPIGIVLKLFGNDLLDDRINPNQYSYWVERKNRVIQKEYFERQF